MSTHETVSATGMRVITQGSTFNEQYLQAENQPRENPMKPPGLAGRQDPDQNPRMQRSAAKQFVQDAADKKLQEANAKDLDKRNVRSKKTKPVNDNNDSSN